MMWGIELRDAAVAERAVKKALARGVILLQAGVRGEVLSITPPLVIGGTELEDALTVLAGSVP